MRGLRWFVVIVVVLGVLAVVADRVGAWFAERAVADKVADELASNQIDSGPPDVKVEGVPFLTQVTSGRYEQVTVVLREISSSEVQLREVTLVASGVTVTADTLISGEGPIDAERIDGTATISYADLAQLTGVDNLELGPEPGGGIQVRLPTEVADQEATLAGTAEVAVADGAVQVRVEELRVEEPPSGLPPGAESVIQELRAQLQLDVALPPLPYGLTVEAVRTGPGGVVVEVTATDVALAR